MRLARIETAAGPRQVVQRGDRWIGVHDIFAEHLDETGESFDVSGARYLSPVEPRVVLGMAHNGSAADRLLPPQAFLKSARTVVGEHDRIVLDDGIGTVHVEGELAVVIRKQARNLTAIDVASVILGYTVGNDVTAVDQIALDEKMVQAKNGDGYTPLGPWIETDLDASGVGIRVDVNGATVSQSTTAQLAYDVTEQLMYLSSIMTLGPGDVVMAGCPGTWAPVRAGDAVEISIDGIGTLANPVV